MQGLLRRRREESGCGENGVRIKTRSRLGPPCYALHRSSPRSMRPRTPLNAATMRLVLRYVGIDAQSKACSFHDNTILILLIMRPLTAINCRLQLHMSSAYENGTMERTPFLRVSCESVSGVARRCATSASVAEPSQEVRRESVGCRG